MGVISRALVRPETYVGWAREAIGTAGVRGPLPIRRARSRIRRSPRHADRLHATPVILVHGYGHNRSGWFVIERYLRAGGFTNIATLNYNPLVLDVPRLADRLGQRIEAIRHHTGAERVHVVGHSLGGIILRWYVQEAGGDETVDTAVTIASPHRGTPLAARAVRPHRRPASPRTRGSCGGSPPPPARRRCGGSPTTRTSTSWCSPAPPR